MNGPRAILHVDMDAFFASVEQLDNPALRGRPVLVGHDGPRGVVAAASYEARTFGCHSAQPMTQAKRCCPQAVIVPGRGARYRELSRRVFTIFEDVTPLVEPLSIDEAFLDVTGSVHLLGEPPAIARLIKQRIRDEVSLTGSVGVAPNKFLAKLASDWDKPDGLTIITPEDIATRVAALPIRKMWGVGPAMERRLRQFGIAIFGDLQRLALEDARNLLGQSGEHFRKLARGLDDRPVTPDHRAKSIGNEQTFGADIPFPEQVRQVLLGEMEHVAMRLRRHDLCGRTVTVKIRYGDFETITRSATLPNRSDVTDELWRAAASLFDRWAATGFRPVRLIGVSVSQLQSRAGRQMELFGGEGDERRRALDRTTDEIRTRYGRGSIHRGIPYTGEPS
ncbi:MAG: DNA polymerase IV [Planctomycetota bacterium]|nr:DNA polymerase IV [Planctomycetota bacterium]